MNKLQKFIKSGEWIFIEMWNAGNDRVIRLIRLAKINIFKGT